MDKQELKEQIQGLSIAQNGLSYDKGNVSGVGPSHKIGTLTALRLINQLYEPKKVVVPKFVAEKIEYLKGMNSPMRDVFSYIDDKRLKDWLCREPDADETLARTWLDGYEVEREKLYTVEIFGASLFKAISDNHVRFEMVDKYHITSANSPYTYISKLTEKEIKSVDERLWQFAKEVER